MEQRPMSKSRLIPAKLFERERGYLLELTEHLCPPYESDERDTDQNGYIAFGGNYFIFHVATPDFPEFVSSFKCI